MELLIAGMIAFATTNIDDIFILTLFFSNRIYQRKSIVIGQFLGIITLIAVALIGSLAGLIINISYIGLLGLVPIFIGLRSALASKQNPSSADESKTVVDVNTQSNFQQIFAVAGVTIANGSDNISIYIPLFAVLSIAGKLFMVCIFLVMTAVWCALGYYLSSHVLIKNTAEKYGHVVTPFVFIILGIYILYACKTFDLLLNL